MVQMRAKSTELFGKALGLQMNAIFFSKYNYTSNTFDYHQIEHFANTTVRLMARSLGMSWGIRQGRVRVSSQSWVGCPMVPCFC